MNSEIDNIYQLLDNISIHDLPQFHKQIQQFIISCHKMKNSLISNDKFQRIPSHILYLISKIEYHLDQQILLTNSFFLCLEINQIDMHLIMKECIKISTENKNYKINLNNEIIHLEIQDLNQFKLTLTFAYLKNVKKNCDSTIILFPDIFNLLQQNFSNGYSKVSLLVYKILNLLIERLFEWNLHYLIDNDIEKILINLIQCNWESPITGISEYNSNLFRILIEHNAIPDHILNEVLKEQMWDNRSKYYMLKSLLPKIGVKKVLEDFPCFFEGLLFSLTNSYLAPAGREVYKIVINSLNIEEWKKYCLEKIITSCFSNITNSVIEKNFMKYWLDPTIKVYPEIFEEFLKEYNSALLKVNLIRIGRKYGMNSYLFSENCFLNICLRHSSEVLRGETFIQLCVSTKNILPEIENEILIKEFLENNINSDCSHLRESILKGISEFILKIITKIIKINVEEKNKNSELKEKENEIKFLKWLHSFLLGNLESGCNYQRKILSLKIYNLVFNCFKKVYSSKKFKGLNIKHKEIDCRDLLLKEIYQIYLTQESFNSLLNVILDPTEDIRENAVNILINHFPSQNIETLELLGFRLCCSPLFYEAESGALFIKIIDHWLVENNFIDLLLQKAEDNLKYLKNNLLKSIMEKKNVHGIYTALQHILSKEDRILEDSQSELLMNLLEESINFFLNILSKESVKGLAPSFSEMGMAIESIIENELEFDEDTLFLSPAYQLLLSCIWINLKEASMLASKLPRKNVHLSNRCGMIIIQVLTRCRHKGAIESAGVALGEIVNSISRNSLTYDITLNWLNESLATIGMSNSITRRSAGLAILVHQIVAHDQQIGKPLLASCIKRLLDILQKPIEEENIQETSDIMHANSMHLFTILFKDASLKNDLIEWMSEITIICFSYLNSQLWTIRNAAYQLFGALVPKLIGSNKSQDEFSNNGNISVEEFIFNYPKLSQYILKIFTNSNGDNTSLLVPALTLIAKLKIGIKIFRTKFIQETIEEYKSIFYSLISNKTFLIRRLAAKAFVNFCNNSDLKETINQIKNKIIYLNNQTDYLNNNTINGLVLILNFFKIRCELIDQDKLEIKIEEMNFKQLSFFTLPLTKTLETSTYIPLEKILTILEEMDQNSIIKNGIEEWIKEQIKTFVLNSPELLLTTQISLIPENSLIIDTFFKTLEKRINEKNLSLENIQKIFEQIANIIIEKRFVNPTILKVLIFLFYKFEINFETNIDILMEFFNFVSEKNNSLEMALILPTITALFPKNLDVNHPLISLVLNEIKKRSHPNNNEDFRINASKALFFCGKKCLLNSLKDENLIEYILDSTILLLHDEDIDIRKKTTSFASLILGQNYEINPYLSLKLIIEDSFLKQFFSNRKIFLFYWTKLDDSTLNINRNLSEIVNPFHQEVVNIYAEEIKLVTMIYKNINDLLKKMELDVLQDLKEIIKGRIVFIEENINILTNEDLKAEYNINIKIATKKVLYLVKILNEMNIKDLNKYEKNLEDIFNKSKIDYIINFN